MYHNNRNLSLTKPFQQSCHGTVVFKTEGKFYGATQAIWNMY